MQAWGGREGRREGERERERLTYFMPCACGICVGRGIASLFVIVLPLRMLK